MMGLALKTGSHRFEWQHTRVSGEQFPVEVLLTAMPEESGGKIIHVTWADITDRKQAEKAVQESEAYYRLLFESSIDAIFVADVQTGQILDANYQAEQLMGRPRSELLKMNQTDLHSDAEKYRKVFREHIREGIRSPALRFGEVVHCDGTLIPVEINAGMVDLGGRSVVIGSFHDLRGRQEQERALQASEEHLRSVFRIGGYAKRKQNAGAVWFVLSKKNHENHILQ